MEENVVGFFFAVLIFSSCRVFCLVYWFSVWLTELSDLQILLLAEYELFEVQYVMHFDVQGDR